MCRLWRVYTLRKEVTPMGYQAISVFTLLSQVIIKLLCSSLCIYNTILARKCQYYKLDVRRLIVKVGDYTQLLLSVGDYTQLLLSGAL